MVMFLVGLAVGIGLVMAALTMVTVRDDETERSGNKCRGCVYQIYDTGEHDCSACHEAGEY